MDDSNPAAVGVDWASGDWLAVSYSETTGFDGAVFESISECWSTYQEHAERILVDIPIGLCDQTDDGEYYGQKDDTGELYRECDSLARELLGRRRRSVFTPPARRAAKQAAGGERHNKVSELNREITGKGLMKQSANIAAPIMEVDTLLDENGDADRLLEAHPELCFRALNGTPLSHSKSTVFGVTERLDILSETPEYDTADWQTVVNSIETTASDVTIDDVLDALVLAVTASAEDEQFHTLPASPPRDAKGRPMQTCYRAVEPFEI